MTLSIYTQNDSIACHYDECRDFYGYAENHYVECHYAECHYAECHYAECRYAECHGAIVHNIGKYYILSYKTSYLNNEAKLY